MFRLSEKSTQRLYGVHNDLVRVVERAIELTTVDFTVYEGLRTKERQAAMLAAGNSRTLDSRHLTGHAVDLVPIIGGSPRWEWGGCYAVATAVAKASQELSVPIRWGGVWDRLMSEYAGTHEAMQKAVADYCRRHPGPDFIDGPHFELPKEFYR